MLDMLTDSPDEQLLRAEAFRELGHFVESMAAAVLLDGEPRADAIRALAAASVEDVSVVVAVAGASGVVGLG